MKLRINTKRLSRNSQDNKECKKGGINMNNLFHKSLLVIVAVVCLLAGFALLQVTKTSKAARQACSVDITAPKPGAHVRRRTSVSGTAKGIPDDSYLWILAHRKTYNGWWPQGGGAVTVKEGIFEVLVFYGEPGETGEFETAAVVVDKQTNEDLKRWVAEAQSKGYPPTNFPNPVGTCPVKTISVVKDGD
jgi:hypothetical protein